MNDTRSNAVVLFDEPLIERIATGTDIYITREIALHLGFYLYIEPEMAKLKGCALFWNRILIYEGYLRRLCSFPWLAEFAHRLFENDLLKIMRKPEDLRDWLQHSISNLDRTCLSSRENLLLYLYENAEKVVVQPDLSKHAEEVITEATEKDYHDKKLRQLYDSLAHERIAHASLDLRSAYHRIHSSRNEKTRYNFEYLNRVLLEQLAIGSALCTDSIWTSLYRYKLGERNFRDGTTFLDGLDVCVPLAQRNSVCELSLDEILKLRKNRKWNKAMDTLARLCSSAKAKTDVASFKETLTLEIIREYQLALEEERMTKTSLFKTVGKGIVYSGVSLVPIIGDLISTTASTIDPIIDYLWKNKRQKNLPFFLNDMRKMGRNRCFSD